MSESKFDLGLNDDDDQVRRKLNAAELEFLKKKPTKRKTKKPIRVTVDLGEELHMQLKMVATLKKRPMTEEVKQAIEHWLNLNKNTPGSEEFNRRF